MTNIEFLTILLLAVNFSVGFCIYLNRPDYAEPITKVEIVLVMCFWWLFVLLIQAKNFKERMGGS